uniref:Uncharacterized protein n=1 Tax=Oryza punctata TaxID=4537 RepID=A0A0E0KZI2_ORYPU
MSPSRDPPLADVAVPNSSVPLPISPTSSDVAVRLHRNGAYCCCCGRRRRSSAASPSISDVEIEELGNSMKDELRNYLSLNIVQANESEFCLIPRIHD